jgi:hypothetical protein
MPNKTFSLKELETVARAHTGITVERSGTGAFLATELGARILGLYPDTGLGNTLWAPEKLDEKMRHKSWFMGGERLWIAPERDFFYENPRDFDNHRVPASFDPGEYTATGPLTYENHFSLLNVMRNDVYDSCTARRAFAPLDDPYSSGLAFCGIAVNDTITIDTPAVTMCGWSITQTWVRDETACGTGLFPVRPGARLLGYFGPIPADRAEVLDGYARFRLDAAEVYKLAIRPEDIVFENPAKAVYVSPYAEADKWFCLIKRSNDIPKTQQECVDPSKADPHGPKGATHSYNNGPRFGDNMPFGEIELQLAKGVTNNGSTTSAAAHELLSYAGKKGEIMELAAAAMGLKLAPVIY